MTRATPPNAPGGRKRRTTSGSDLKNDDGPTRLDGPRLGEAFSDSGRAVDSTAVDGPPAWVAIDPHDTDSSDLFLDGDEEDDVDDPTVYRGDRPPRPSSSRRLSPTLMKIFQRKREQIGLSIAQVAKLTGIDEEELTRFEGTNGGHRLVYDHAVLVARVLGIRPQDMPGLRAREGKDPAAGALGSLTTALLGGPILTFEGKSGERFGGDLERLGTTPHFAVRIGDTSLGEAWPRGALLGFVMDASPQPGDVALLRHKRTRQLALRRANGQSWAPLSPWQPAYPTSGDWAPFGRLQIVLPRP